MNKEFQVTLSAVRCEKTYDVAVVGGGTAGVMAAIAAAESGKDVLIVEKSYTLGGSSTLGQVTPLMGTRIKDGLCNSYIGVRLQRRLEERGFTDGPWPSAPKTIFSPVTLSVVLEEMCAEAGVDILYGAAFVDVMKEGDRVTALLAQTLEGLMAIEAAFVIDATGDAQVAYAAGCPFEVGDPENDGHNQNMSLRFCIGGIDYDRVNQSLEAIGGDPYVEGAGVYMGTTWADQDDFLTKLFKKAVEAGDLIQTDATYFQAFSSKAFGDGVMYFNCPEAPHCRHTTDSFEVSDGVRDCRAATMRLHKFLQKYIRGFENSTVISFAQMPGVRESRRIKGEYWLTIDDYNARAKFADGVAQSAYPVDVHGRSETVHPASFARGEYFEVPYRSLIPKGIDNMLVAGRCISASFWAQSATRIQLVCHALGEAAGLAASMALDLSCAAKQVDGAAVRAEMRARGGTFAAG